MQMNKNERKKLRIKKKEGELREKGRKKRTSLPFQQIT